MAKIVIILQMSIEERPKKSIICFFEFNKANFRNYQIVQSRFVLKRSLIRRIHISYLECITKF